MAAINYQSVSWNTEIYENYVCLSRRVPSEPTVYGESRDVWNAVEIRDGLVKLTGEIPIAIVETAIGLARNNRTGTW
jgi:hypothetical protein